MKTVALAGGVGAARFLAGLQEVMAPENLTIVGNTGDDLEVFGLHVSPDLDSVTYTLAGAGDAERGWGLAGETFACLAAMRRFGVETWFQLGDRDLATHLFRTQMLRAGQPLSAATAAIARAFGLGARLLPMSDAAVRTRVRTPEGWLDFQDYFVRRRFEDAVLEVAFAGVEAARPAPGVLEAIGEAGLILISPSNPFVSIGPILALPGLRPALDDARGRGAKVVAVTPIIGGAAVKGPADRMLATLGHEVSAVGVAAIYRDLVDVFVLDERDRALAPRIAALGVRVEVLDTLMRDLERQRALAAAVLGMVA
jgi:LPPG:FO 2-phospho-L-lactate transferase